MHRHPFSALVLALVPLIGCGGPASRSGRRDAVARRPDARSAPVDAAWTPDAAASRCGELGVDDLARSARWVALARWRPRDLAVDLALDGEPPARVPRVELDPCLAADPAVVPADAPVVLVDRPGREPYAHPVVWYGLNHLRGLLQPGRPGRTPAPAGAVDFALARGLPAYLRGRRTTVTHPPLAGSGRTVAGMHLRYVAEPGATSVRICTATALGPLRYVDGYYPEGDGRGRPRGDRHQGFQVLFLERTVAGKVAHELLSVVWPKVILRGRCPVPTP